MRKEVPDWQCMQTEELLIIFSLRWFEFTVEKIFDDFDFVLLPLEGAMFGIKIPFPNKP